MTELRPAPNRRDFMKTTAAGAAALWLPGLGLRSASPNDEIRVGVIGFRSRGKGLINGLHRLPGVRVVALCDVDRQVLDAEAAKFAKRGDKVSTDTDLRRLMDRDDIDVIATATPNHWHALIAVWACQAGKDVYVEKPVSHNVWEGRQIVNAARRHGRIVQTGTQCRSSSGITAAIAWLQAGGLGRINVARGICYKPRRSIGKANGPQSIPNHIDYDLWTGPAAMKPLARKNLHYDWHWVTDTGNGDLGNQGIHQMDICRWALGIHELAPRVLSVGGRVGYDDDGDTPNSQFIVHDYAKAPLVFEVRGLPRSTAEQKAKWRMDRYRGVGIGCSIECEDGTLIIPSYSSAEAFDKNGKSIRKWKGGGDHYADFIGAVRSRRHNDLNADILEGHLSSALCHTGNISHAVGRQAGPREIEEALGGHAVAAETFERFGLHLTANGVDMKKDGIRLGAWLDMDPTTERFKDNSAANRLLARDYRAPFAVPSVT